MNAALVDEFSKYVYPGYRNIADSRGNVPQAEKNLSVQRFVQIYENLAFGWTIAETLAKRNAPWPLSVTGADQWVHRAYLSRLYPSRYYHPHIAQAYALAQEPLKRAGRILRSMLLVGETSYRKISKETGVAVGVVEAFSTLFFNVKDRLEDNRLLIANIVYPETRIVTWLEDYIKTSGICDLLMRAGYDSQSLHAVAYISGMDPSSYIDQVSADPDSKDRVEKSMTGAAYVLAAAGLTHQPMLGMRNYKSLLIADKQGNAPPQQDPVTGLASGIISQLQQADQEQEAIRKQVRREREAEAQK